MKQILQRLDTGRTYLEEVPAPATPERGLVVRSAVSVVSAGTELALRDFGRASLLEKARDRPEKVREVVDKARTEGIRSTVDAARAKLGTPIPLGYCQAGTVLDVGPGVRGVARGDRVVTNGPHAEVVAVSQTLAARIPDGVSFEAAAFTPLAAIGLQGIRLADPTIGETAVVYGLGLVGLLSVQILRANGCRVIGVDFDPARLSIAAGFGAHVIDARSDDVVKGVRALTEGIGADAVLLTLSSDDDEPVHLAAQASRKRGRLVLVGVTGLKLRREEFYEKELSFTVSCSYGPGRYDPSYEQKARDYPLPFVRWTEQRNFQAVLQLMSEQKLDPTPLISERVPFGEAPAGYELFDRSPAPLGVVFEYDQQADPEPESRAVSVAAARPTEGVPSVGVIGAGNYAMRTLLPALKGQRVRLHTLVSTGGTSAGIGARRFGFEVATTDTAAVLADPDIDAVFVLTRHDSHADLAVAALEHGKHVFVEKPLALSHEDLERVARAREQAGDRIVMVGFNRRFSPLTERLERRVRARSGPLTVLCTVNAGSIPRTHWVHDPAAGGGRIVGEAVHWIDLARHLVDAPIEDVHVSVARDAAGAPVDDIATISLGFEDGSTASVHYLSHGAPGFPKERIECFFDGETLAIDNWRRFRDHGASGFRLPGLPGAVDKGHATGVERFLAAIRDGTPAPIPFEEILEVSRAAIDAGAAATGREGKAAP